MYCIIFYVHLSFITVYGELNLYIYICSILYVCVCLCGHVCAHMYDSHVSCP